MSVEAQVLFPEYALDGVWDAANYNICRPQPDNIRPGWFPGNRLETAASALGSIVNPNDHQDLLGVIGPEAWRKNHPRGECLRLETLRRLRRASLDLAHRHVFAPTPLDAPA